MFVILQELGMFVVSMTLMKAVITPDARLDQ
jgi:hypothetical protein